MADAQGRQRSKGGERHGYDANHDPSCRLHFLPSPLRPSTAASKPGAARAGNLCRQDHPASNAAWSRQAPPALRQDPAGPERPGVERAGMNVRPARQGKATSSCPIRRRDPADRRPPQRVAHAVPVDVGRVGARDQCHRHGSRKRRDHFRPKPGPALRRATPLSPIGGGRSSRTWLSFLSGGRLPSNPRLNTGGARRGHDQRPRPEQPAGQAGAGRDDGGVLPPRLSRGQQRGDAPCCGGRFTARARRLATRPDSRHQDPRDASALHLLQ